MRTHRPILALALVLALMSTGFDSCSSGGLASKANKVVEVVQSVLPLINTGNALAAIRHGKDLSTAFKIKDYDAALELTSLLITDFARLRADVAALPDSKQRTYILAILAAGDVALHFIADNIPTPTPDQMKGSTPKQAKQLATIAIYRNRKRWACRNSQTGRFEKMEFCQKHPDVSQVDTF